MGFPNLYSAFLLFNFLYGPVSSPGGQIKTGCRRCGDTAILTDALGNEQSREDSLIFWRQYITSCVFVLFPLKVFFLEGNKLNLTFMSSLKETRMHFCANFID